MAAVSSAKQVKEINHFNFQIYDLMPSFFSIRRKVAAMVMSKLKEKNFG